MSSIFDPRYLLNHPYSKDEFIFLTEVLIQANQDDPFSLDILQKNLAWAKQHQDDAQISWEEDGKGGLKLTATTIKTSLNTPPSLE